MWWPVSWFNRFLFCDLKENLVDYINKKFEANDEKEDEKEDKEFLLEELILNDNKFKTEKT